PLKLKMNLLSRLKYLASLHLYTHIHAYDPILDSANPFIFVQLPRLQFIVIIIACLLIRLYGTLLLEYDAKGCIECNGLLRSPHILTHQIFPRTTWPHTDMLFFVCYLGALILYAAFWATPTLETKYRMYRNGDTIVMGDKSKLNLLSSH